MRDKNVHGTFIISFDFELFWGVRDKMSKDLYGARILGVRKAIPSLLDLFKEFDISATFFTVGFLFCKDKKELLEMLPASLPHYADPEFSAYGDYLDTVGKTEEDDPYHFARSLIQRIKENGDHEIASHTFSHYYCLEEGQTKDNFRNDIQTAKSNAENLGIELKTIAFPRNQVNKEYLSICKELGLVAYRGTEKSWIYEPRQDSKEKLLRRALRLADAYVNITGHHCYGYKETSKKYPYNIASSRFLRPYSKKLLCLDRLRVRRIKKSMTHAAKHDLIYHLWWHPHNFGQDLEENLSILRDILEHYKILQQQFNFESRTVYECAAILKKTDHER